MGFVRDALHASSHIRLTRNFRVAVVGAGIGGVAMGHALKQAGCTDFAIYEKADSIGGTWRDNRYPGVACDIPSYLYSFSFAPNPEWSQTCAPGAEIRDYVERVACASGLLPHTRFGKELIESQYHEGEWHLRFADGTRTRVDVLVACTGILHVPRNVEYPGLQDFAGKLVHSACWPAGLDVRGLRVGSIGNGSSSTQLVPALIDQVSELKLFQRTAQWIFPVERRVFTEQEKEQLRAHPERLHQLYDDIMDQFEDRLGKLSMGDPQTMREFAEACQANLERVTDPELRRKLTPGYAVHCKRLVMSDRFYEAIQHEKCTLVTSPIERFERGGIRCRGGALHELDVVVLATGFKSDQYCRSIAPRGEDGITLEELWHDGVASFETVALARFPNLFMIGGPTTSVTSVSYITGAELQARYIIRAMKLLEERQAKAMAPREEVQARYIAANRQIASQTVFMSGCSSWYLDAKGHFQFYAGHPRAYVEMLARGPNSADYRFLAHRAHPETQQAADSLAS